MRVASRVFGAVVVLGILLSSQANGRGVAFAQQPNRFTTIIVPYTEYEWWLIAFSDNSVLCSILVDHEGLPTLEEAAADCSQQLANDWFNTPSCNVETIADCTGVYVFLFSTTPKEREVLIELPAPTVWIDLEGCSPTPPTNLCPTLPALILTAEEPLPNHAILDIQGVYDGQPFICNAAVCMLPTRISPILGSTIEFWANSSFGDSSERYTAQVRIIDTGVSPQPGGSGFYVDVISSQWRGAPLASCAGIWESFPPIGAPPVWLSSPDHFELLASEEPYYYLAGRLIVQGLVDVSACPAGGLLPNGYADACGLEKSRPILAEWQNQFDQRIIEVGAETGVPAQLMKNLFAQESQFWPGVFRVPFEFGLGQITERGTDTVLIWNTEFYNQFCPLVLSKEACDMGYLGLTLRDQGILRGALALQARADCNDCPTGIDLRNVNFTVALFANTLIANCAQVARTVYTATSSMAGRVATYEDLWRLTIANYHAGPGCLSYAVHQAWTTSNSLAWSQVSPFFTEPCKGVVPYVDQITR
jgi:hypothetical protein